MKYPNRRQQKHTKKRYGVRNWREYDRALHSSVPEPPAKFAAQMRAANRRSTENLVSGERGGQQL